MAEERSIEIRRWIDAPPEEVFDAWTDAESMREWMLPGTAERATATLDPRVGGKFEIVMFAGGRVLPHRGEYLRIERPRILEFTWISDGTKHQRSVVTIELEPDGSGTMLTLRHRPLPDDEAARSHEKGWGKIVELLAKRVRRAS